MAQIMPGKDAGGIANGQKAQTGKKKEVRDDGLCPSGVEPLGIAARDAIEIQGDANRSVESPFRVCRAGSVTRAQTQP
ncbi:hypothetical protein BTR14_00190 [Rhizobium rhizosphaerae]|uniref:Uncharacterized protein n=1 Tax=Xaviernesmea rhizosphaerae TaxID=1672749 RepID=A0ABX3PIL7_9HYPH|nr:hypothetical protein BTR14_00190 [Xaviernesmea rhizosphaerae]